MPIKLLIPLDGSEAAMRAVEYVASTFGHTPDVQITLIHILPELPPSFWDDGHILSEGEHQNREARISDWETAQSAQWQSIFAQARDKLIKAGIAAEALKIKFQAQYGDVAEDILDEAEAEGCSTIIIGRSGQTGARKFFPGSVTDKVVNHPRGMAVTLVDHGHREELPKPRTRPPKERRVARPKAKSRRSCWEKFLHFSKYWPWG
jgi:nucleotide-binding universal stress UspA family protein